MVIVSDRDLSLVMVIVVMVIVVMVIVVMVNWR